MAKRPDDTVRIESVQGSDFAIVVDRATSFEVTHDLSEPASARFELGDDGSWSALKDALQTGTRFKVVVNDRAWLTGRMLAKQLPISASAGSTIRLSVRTRLADAAFASASPDISVRKASLKEVVLAAYGPLGLTEADFLFSADAARDLLTGKAGRSSAPADLAAIKEDDAKVHPPETIAAFVERHLNRFHLSHWDAPDGRIVIGAPDDTQAPLYVFRCRKGDRGQLNNILDCEKSEDFEEVPTVLGVFGVGGGKQWAKSRVRAVEEDPTLAAVDPPLYRPVLIVDEAVKLEAQASARARLEMSMRSRAKDAWRVTLDGLSYWDGKESIPLAIGAIADLQVDTSGVVSGAYLITRTTLRGDADNGFSAQLDLVAKGIWRL